MTRFRLKWALIQIRQNLKSFSFYLLTVLFALALWTENAVIKEYSDVVRVMICDGGAALGSDVKKELQENPIDGFEFISEDNPEELIKKVKTGDVSCGLVFSDDDSQATLYQSPDSTNGYVVKEIVFSIMQKINAADWMDDYLDDMTTLSEDGEIIPSDQAKAYVKESYAGYLENMEIDIYDLKTADTAAEPGESRSENSTAELGESTADPGESRSENSIADPGESSTDNDGHGLKIKIFIFITAVTLILCIYDTLSADKGFYAAFDRKNRVIFRLEKIVITLAMSVGCAGLINFIL